MSLINEEKLLCQYCGVQCIDINAFKQHINGKKYIQGNNLNNIDIKSKQLNMKRKKKKRKKKKKEKMQLKKEILKQKKMILIKKMKKMKLKSKRY